ncbi:MAG: TerB family tellurite resistance protein [Deltaproteobacteria bacterium]|nr:TerB family tellurite resistance protein [Deltaproteobacteria bacterium]
MTDTAGRYQIKPDDALLEELTKRRELRGMVKNFLLSGGLLAGHSDGELCGDERACLLLAMSSLFDDPEAALAELTSPEQAIAMLKESMAWLEENSAKERLPLYKYLAQIVAADGVLDRQETSFMQNVAKGLGVPSELARAIVLEAMKSVRS